MTHQVIMVDSPMQCGHPIHLGGIHIYFMIKKITGVLKIHFFDRICQL